MEDRKHVPYNVQYSPVQGRIVSHSTGLWHVLLNTVCKYKFKYKSAGLYYIIMQKSFTRTFFFKKPNNCGENHYGGGCLNKIHFPEIIVSVHSVG